jgi:hypothetical protein
VRLAREITDEGERLRALLALVSALPDSALPDMVAALADIGGSSRRESLIIAIASRKPAALVAALAAAARTLHAEDRARALRAVADMIPAPDPALVAEALAAAREATDPAVRADALRGLSGLTDGAQREQLLEEALSDSSSAGNRPSFSVTLEIAELLPAARRRSVTGKLLSDTLDRPAGPDRTWYLVRLASGLSKAQLATVIPVVLATEPEEDRAELLAAYAPYLTDQFLPQALQAVATLRDQARRALVLLQLAPSLPEPLLAEALSAVSGITDADTRWSCVAELAGRLPEGLLGQALGMVQSSASDSGTARFLLGLAQRWGEPRGAELLREALASARAAADGFLRAQALGDLASSLAAGERDLVLAEAGEAAKGYAGDYGAVYALDYLIRRAAGRRRKKLIDDAFARTRAMPDSWWRPAWLAALARYVPQPERVALLAEALAGARSLPATQEQLSALIEIAVGFPGHERASVYREALALAGDGERLDTGAQMTLALARAVPGPMIASGLELLRRIECEDTRPPSFGRLLKLFPDSKVDEALAVLRDYPAGLHAAHVLGTAALHLPERIRPQVLRLALDADQRVIARRAILTQAQQIWPDRITTTEIDTLRQVLADNGLDDYLNVLAEALDLIVRAAGTQCLDNLLDAYRTVQRWWPPFTPPAPPD